MSLTIYSPPFKQYTTYLLKQEGKTSKDPQDSAVSCAPFPGAVHTNKGVTFCTFKQSAAALGMTPVTYERFLKLSDTDVSRFLYQFYKAVRGKDLPDPLALSLTEVGWMSGPDRAIKTLQIALNKLGNTLSIDGDFGPLTLAAVKRSNLQDLYSEFWKERERFLLNLSADPAYDQYRTNWINRLRLFISTFPPIAAAGVAGILIIGAVFWIISRK